MTETTTSDSNADGITITRIFDAPRELVFKAWTEPESFAYWFGGTGASVPIETVSMDVRPGGEWSATMLAGPDGTIPWRGVYREVVPPERLVFTLADRPGDAYELVTVVLTDLGDKTEMAFRQTGGNIDAEGYAQAKDGWLAFFDAMAEVLTRD